MLYEIWIFFSIRKWGQWEKSMQMQNITKIYSIQRLQERIQPSILGRKTDDCSSENFWANSWQTSMEKKTRSLEVCRKSNASVINTAILEAERVHSQECERIVHYLPLYLFIFVVPFHFFFSLFIICQNPLKKQKRKVIGISHHFW